MQATTFKARRINFHDMAHQGTNELFSLHWPDYKSWFSSKLTDAGSARRIKAGKEQLAKHMPEFIPVYESLCVLTKGCPVAADFLTGYQPPAYLVSCSQAVIQQPQPTLIRNYDLSPDLAENMISWADLIGRKVIGTNECLWGLDDGMNDAGLVASITFGGSKQVGTGFGIPFIIRYLLHCCTTVEQAISVLERIPSHMAYNVTLLDKTGDFATVFVAPDQAPIVTRESCTTNHQQQVVWPEQAVFSKTLKRKRHLERLLGRAKMNADDLLQSFLAKPLHSTNYAQQFGTVFTAMYQPTEGTLTYHWPDQPPLALSFAAFVEQDRVVQLDGQPVSTSQHLSEPAFPVNPDDGEYRGHVPQAAPFPVDHVSAYIPDNLREVLLMPLSHIPGANRSAGIKRLQRALVSGEPLSWCDYGWLHVAGVESG